MSLLFFSRRLLRAVAGLGFFSVASFAMAEVRLSPNPDIVQIGSLEEPLTPKTFIRASLLASGADLKELDVQMEEFLRAAKAAPRELGNRESLAENVLFYMHENFLTNYVERQTRMDVLLNKGTYNCVSSAVMYYFLVSSLGIPVHGVETTDHAFIHLPDTDDGVDVETTTLYGYDPGTRNKAVNEFTGRTGFTYVPPGNYRLRTNIDGKQLIALIYQNRMSLLQKQGKWEETIGLARDRWTLTGDDNSRKDFISSINNYATAMNQKNRHREGLIFLNRAADILGSSEGLDYSAKALLGNAVNFELKRNRTTQVLDLLNNAELTRLVSQSFLDEKRKELNLWELNLLVKSGDFKTATIAVDAALKKGTLNQSQWEKNMLYLWSNEARRRSLGNNWVQGLYQLEEAPIAVQKIPRWKSLIGTYQKNVIAGYHNQFAAAMNKKDFTKANLVLKEGLKQFPDAPLLIRDRRSLDALE